MGQFPRVVKVAGRRIRYNSEMSRATAPSPLRVLMIAPTSFFADYGCHVRILEEVRALTARGHKVRVCTYHNGMDIPGVDIHRSVDIPWLQRAEVGSSRHKAYLDVALFFEAARQAVRFRPDVIHAHLHEGALIGGIIGRLLRIPVVFDYQGSLTEEMLDHGFIRERGRRERFFRYLERVIDRLPAQVIPSSQAGKQHLTQTGLSDDRITIIHDGVDLQRFDPSTLRQERDDTRARLGIPVAARVVIYLGLLAEYQGTPTLIEAARLLIPRYPDLYVVVAGYPGPERYAAMAADLPRDRILFPGRIPYDEAPALLAAGDVAVAPKLSTTESNGKLFNYMALKLPIVASDTVTNRSILGELGHLFPPGDAHAMAEAVEAAFSDTVQQRNDLRGRVRSLFDWRERVIELEQVYARVTGQNITLPRAMTTTEEVALASD